MNENDPKLVKPILEVRREGLLDPRNPGKWSATIDELLPVLHQLRQGRAHGISHVAEIGVRYGETAGTMLEVFPEIEKYYAIDPFEVYDDYATDGFNNDLARYGPDVVYDHFIQGFGHEPCMHILRMRSSAAVTKIKDKELDFCFIDGNHAYEYVYEDIQNYYPKVRAGGIIAGDDYFMRHHRNDPLGKGGYNEDMVYEAVQDFFNQCGWRPPIQTVGVHQGYPKLWWVRKS